MNREKLTATLNYLNDRSGTVTGLLIAMRHVWDSLDASDEALALRALIDAATRTMEDLDEQTGAALRLLSEEETAG